MSRVKTVNRQEKRTQKHSNMRFGEEMPSHEVSGMVKQVLEEHMDRIIGSSSNISAPNYHFELRDNFEPPRLSHKRWRSAVRGKQKE